MFGIAILRSKDFAIHHELMSSENNALLDDRELVFRFLNMLRTGQILTLASALPRADVDLVVIRIMQTFQSLFAASQRLSVNLEYAQYLKIGTRCYKLSFFCASAAIDLGRQRLCSKV
jgi:hypothetical protein